jgi:Fuc2NAc and GlcNAc transferase
MDGEGWRMASYGVLSLGVAVAATPLVRIAVLRLGLLDRPNPRSSHRTVVARGGGLAIVAAVVACIAVTRSARGQGPADLALLAGGLVLAAVGLCDDRVGLPPFVRLVLQIGVAAGFVWFAGGFERLPLPPPLNVPLGPFGSITAVLWIVAVINFYNFMDGIDGLAALQGVVTGVGIAVADWDPFASLLGASLAGACAGFLVFNWSPARIFLGDVGSGVLGFAFAALPLLAPPSSRDGAVLFVGLSLWLFLADTTWTLARRIARRERWYEAHRQHLYQRLVDSGSSHAVVAGSLGLGSAALTAAALWAWRADPSPRSWAAVALAVALFAVEAILARSRTGSPSRVTAEAPEP